MGLLINSKKIAVTGTFGSGKSVFLLSLLNQLHHHDPKYFRLGEKREGKSHELKGLEALPVDNQNELFPFKTFAQRLMRAGGGIWPSRYHARQRFRVAFKRNNRFKRDEFSFVSFPLERMLDLSIARTERYADWADRILFQIFLLTY